MSSEPKRVLITGAAGNAFGQPWREPAHPSCEPYFPTFSMPTALHWTTCPPCTLLRPVTANPLNRRLIRPAMLSFAGQIGYALCPQVARGGMLGHNQPIILHLLDFPPAQQSLEGVKMELVDAAFPLLKGTTWQVLLTSAGINDAFGSTTA